MPFTENRWNITLTLKKTFLWLKQWLKKLTQVSLPKQSQPTYQRRFRWVQNDQDELVKVLKQNSNQGEKFIHRSSLTRFSEKSLKWASMFLIYGPFFSIKNHEAYNKNGRSLFPSVLTCLGTKEQSIASLGKACIK